ncbi:MAG: hypothetical protein IJ168_01670 [Eubacterium sp.]|nr:hypothetical protein [Eubacterium sp.]
MFKRIISLLLILILPMCLFGCALEEKTDKTANTVVDLGESRLYSEEDRKTAAEKTMYDYEHSPAIAVLYSVTYAGDDASEETKKYYGDGKYEEVILFYVSFHTKQGAASHGFNNDCDYDVYRDALGKNARGEWETIDGACGY